MHKLVFIGAIILMALTACGTESSNEPQVIVTTPETVYIVVTATEPAAPQTSVAANTRPTLPPTFTPTATNTATSTPTITLTPTITPTPQAADICATFSISSRLAEVNTLNTSESVVLFVDTGGREVNAVLNFVNEETGENTAFGLPGGGAYPANIPMDLDTGPGRYTWSIYATTANYSNICETSGTFILTPRSPVSILLETLDDLITEP